MRGVGGRPRGGREWSVGELETWSECWEGVKETGEIVKSRMGQAVIGKWE